MQRMREEVLLLKKQRKVRDKPKAKGVYVIGVRGGAMKIGITSNIDSRLATLQNGHAEKLKLYYFSDELPDGMARAVERDCHKRAGDSRLNGEWFNLGWLEAVDLVKKSVARHLA